MVKQHITYKESNISWLGKIPVHWQVKRIKDLGLKYFTGFTPEKDEFSDSKGDFTWVTISDMKSKNVDYSAIDISAEIVNKRNQQITPKGSLLFSFKLSIGKVAFAGKDLYTNEAIVSILPTNKISLDYLYYLLPLALYNNATENIYRAKMLNQKIISNISLGIPPIEEQRAIAEYLDREVSRIDRIVELLTAQQERYDQLKRSLISEVISKGLPHHNPSTFRSLRLKDIGQINSAGVDKKVNDEDTKVYMLNYLDIYKSKTFSIESNEGFMEVTATDDQIDSKDVLRGDVFFTPSSETIEDIGVSAVVLKDLPNTVYSYHIVRFRPHTYLNLLNPEYCKYLFNNNSVQYYMSQNSKGTTRKILNLSVFESLKVCLPNIEEQKEIVEYLDERCIRIDRISELIGRKIELMESLKKSLIEEVVTGQRCVVN